MWRVVPANNRPHLTGHIRVLLQPPRWAPIPCCEWNTLLGAGR